MGMLVEGAPKAEGGLNHAQEQRPLVKHDAAPPEEHPAKAESVKDALARSYFDEPRWPLHHVLSWIALRDVRAIHDDIRSLRFRRHVHDFEDNKLESPPPKVKNPVVELLKTLRAGGIAAIDDNHQDIKAEFWDGGLRSTNLADGSIPS